MDLNQSKWASDIENISNTILDVRTPEEFNEGYIPKSINLIYMMQAPLCLRFNHSIKKTIFIYIVNLGLEAHKPVKS